MNSPYTPWVVLGSILLAVLYLKGYLKLPAGTQSVQPQPPKDYVGHMVRERMDSRSLGLMFAKAVQAEAQEKLAMDFATKAGDDLVARFTAPFSPPAPAGPSDPSQAGAPPSP